MDQPKPQTTDDAAKLQSVDDAIKQISEQISCLQMDTTSSKSTDSGMFEPIFKRNTVMAFTPLLKIAERVGSAQLIYSVPLGLAQLDAIEARLVYARLVCLCSTVGDTRVLSACVQSGVLEFNAAENGMINTGDTTPQPLSADFNMLDLRWVSTNAHSPLHPFLIVTSSQLVLIGYSATGTRDMLEYKSPIDGIELSNVVYASVYRSSYVGLVLRNNNVYSVCIINLEAAPGEKRTTTLFSGVPASDAVTPQCIEFFDAPAGKLFYAVSYKDTTVVRFDSDHGMLQPLSVGPPIEKELKTSKIPRYATPVTEQAVFMRCGDSPKRIALNTLHNSYTWMPGSDEASSHYLTMRDHGAAYNIKLGANYTLFYMRNDTVLLYDNHGHKRAHGTVQSDRVQTEEAIQRYNKWVTQQTPAAATHVCKSCSAPLLQQRHGISIGVVRLNERVGVVVMDKYGTLWVSS